MYVAVIILLLLVSISVINIAERQYKKNKRGKRRIACVDEKTGNIEYVIVPEDFVDKRKNQRNR